MCYSFDNTNRLISVSYFKTLTTDSKRSFFIYVIFLYIKVLSINCLTFNALYISYNAVMWFAIFSCEIHTIKETV